MRTLYANAHVVTMDDAGTEIANGWLLVDDGFVEEIGSGNPPPAEAYENLGGALVTPGLVNTHHHLFQTLTRTRAQQADLFTWLKLLYPVWQGIDAVSEHAAARAGLAELALSGCRPIEYLEQVGWLDGDAWCAHCVHLSQPDVTRLGDARTGVAHCPTSNLRLGAGIAPVREMLDRNVPLGLGVDGSASNERSDLLHEVKQALLVARGRDGPAALTGRDGLRLGTRGGAAVLGQDDIGSLEPGRSADIAIWRTDGLEFGGAEDPVAALVFSAPHRVDRLLVRGEDVVRGGCLVRGEEGEIARVHRAHARRFGA